MSEATTEDPGSPALPQVRLLRNGEDAVVAPLVPENAGAGHPSFEPFKMTKLPRVLSDTLALLCDTVHQRHDRCMAIVLLLELGTQCWTFRVPAQRCSRTSSCWSVRRQDVADLPPDAVLAGSFQTRLLETGEEPADAVPLHDGLHLVQVLEPERHVIWCFLRTQGRTETVPAPLVLFDDVEAWLADCRPRLQFV